MDNFRDKTLNQLQREYYAEIQSLAENCMEEAKEYERDITEVVHETVDGHQWVIYTALAKVVLLLTDQDPQGLLEEMGGHDATDPGLWSVLAFLAVSGDVHERIHYLQQDEEEDDEEE